jgi:endonuclease-3
MRILPREQWTSFANRLIWHGRRVCHAKKPDHDHCVLAPLCPSATLIVAPPKRAAVRRASPLRKKATRVRR